MKTIEIFLASSSELLEDRKAFEIFLNRRNKILVKEGIFLELVIWEDFLDAMSQTRLQDEYNKALQKSDIFIMLFYTKVGKYTHEEFDTAYHAFKTNGKPLVYTYFKDAPGEFTAQDSLQKFKDYLSSLGHFFTVYNSRDKLQLHFMEQLEKLKSTGFLSGNGAGGPNVNIAGDDNGSTPAILDEIKKQIASGKSVSKLLDKYRDDLLALNEDIDMEITMLQGRSAKLDKDSRIGLISTENEGIERARITNALLSLLDDIKDDL